MVDGIGGEMARALNNVIHRAESNKIPLYPNERRALDYKAPDLNHWVIIGAKPHVPLDMEKAMALAAEGPLVQIGESSTIKPNHLYVKVMHKGVSIQAGDGPVLIEDGIKTKHENKDQILPPGDRANIDLQNPVVLHLGTDRNGYAVRIFHKPGKTMNDDMIRMVMNLQGTEISSEDVKK